MRILQVAFKNINSLSGEHEIDFTKEPFSYSSLYAITGSTGSGKSSILDAISLALYNVTPRMGKISNNTIETNGAILTRGQREAYAKVTYACKTGIFRSEWHISTARTGNLREYEMSLYNMDSDQALDYNKGMIPKANEERIGLSYEQFNKSVMLAQGEFAEFLKAPKKDRGDLLEKITGSDIYRRIGIAVFQKAKEQELKTKDLNLILDNKKEAQKPKEEVDAKIKEELALQKQLKLLEKQVEEVKEQNRRIEEILKKETQLEQTKQELLNSNKALESFMSEDGKSWQEHKRLLPYLSEIQSWEQSDLNLKRLEEQQQSLKKEKVALETESKEILGKISGIIQEDCSPHTAIEKLDVFNKKYEEVDAKRMELGTKYREHAATADALIKNLNLVFHITSPEFAKNIAGKKEEVQNEYRQLLSQVNIEDNQLTQSAVDAHEIELKSIRQAQLLANEIQSLFKRESETRHIILGLEKTLVELDKHKDRLKSDADLTQLKYEKLELERQNAILTQSLEQHRINLKPGEACPLCGALEHPFAVHAPSLTSEIEIALKEIKELAEKSKALYLKNRNDSESIGIQIANNKQINLDLETKIADLRNKFNESFIKITDTPESFDFNQAISFKETQHKTLLLAVETKKRNTTLNDLLPIAQQIAVLLKEGKALKEYQNSLYQGGDFKQVYQSLREAFQKNRNIWDIKLQQEKNLLEEITTSQEAFQLNSLKLENKLKQQGIESITLALRIRLEDTVYIAFENKQANIQQTLQKVQTQLDIQHKELVSLKQGVRIENKEELQNNLNKQLESLEELRETEKQLVVFLSTQLELQTDIEALEKEIEVISEKAKPLILLQKLIGDAKGARFNDYAQDMTLAYLLQLANKRLEGLNKRYKVDKPGKNEGDNLMVIDKDMGNQRRAINTLSGGETFMVSLALALALSDLAAKNVQIESMFIDEGFGTLDPEALDQTLDALERLQMESSKLIGIISHVDSLKERISTQIQLSQDGKGYSKMNIVG